MVFSPVPYEVKPVAHLMKLAEEHESRNIVVAYWARMAACRLALKITPGKRSPETSNLIKELLDWLEATKVANRDNDGITSEAAAQALIEEYALKMFDHADQQDRAEIFNKNTIKSFYNAGMLFDVLEQFGLAEDLHEKQKYAKWKAAFIHNCLKGGEKPYPGAPSEQPKMFHISELPEEEQARIYEERRKKKEAEEKDKAMNPDSTTFNFPKRQDDIFNNDGAASPVIPQQPSPVTPVFPQQPGSVTPAAPTTPVPPSQPTVFAISSNNGDQVSLTPDQIQKAQKYSKYATSALNYDDIKTAIDNLEKALRLLKTGSE